MSNSLIQIRISKLTESTTLPGLTSEVFNLSPPVASWNLHDVQVSESNWGCVAWASRDYVLHVLSKYPAAPRFGGRAYPYLVAFSYITGTSEKFLCVERAELNGYALLGVSRYFDVLRERYVSRKRNFSFLEYQWCMP